jgi:CheY-like chemotaxis protein
MKQKRTIFYVDDNPKSRRLLAAILEDFGFAVIAASGPLEAVEIARNISFDLALLDYQMPLMSGAQLAEAIKNIVPGAPVVMISGFAAVSTEELDHVDAYHGKGTTLQELLGTIQRLLAANAVTGGQVGQHDIDETRKGQLWSIST